LTTHTPPTHRITTAIDVGLAPPILVEGDSAAPPRAVASTITTIRASSTGISDPTRKLSGRLRPANTSSTTSTSVCIATPPIRFPTARSRWPAMAAEAVIAISGRLPVTASRIRPPSASPRPKRWSSAWVVFAR